MQKTLAPNHNEKYRSHWPAGSIWSILIITELLFTGPDSSVTWQTIRFGEQEVTGSILGPEIQKSLKMVLAAPRFALRLKV